jgi:hypothetical protein
MQQWVVDGIAVRIVIISGEVFVIDWLKRKKIGDHSATHNTHEFGDYQITWPLTQSFASMAGSRITSRQH